MSVQLEPLRRAAQAALQDVTPTRLKLLLVLNGLLALIFCIAAVSTVEQHEHAVRTVGIDAAPSVIAAHEIKIGFEAMDQAVATELLYPVGGDDGREAADAFRNGRQNVAKQLVTAAKNITYGSAEQTPIENIQDGFGDYLMQVQTVRDLHNAGKDAQAIAAYRAVVRVLQTQLLPLTGSIKQMPTCWKQSTVEKRQRQISAGDLCLFLERRYWLCFCIRRSICLAAFGAA